METAKLSHLPVPASPRTRIAWRNLFGSHLSLALSALISETKNPLVIIAPDALTAIRLETEIQFFNPSLPIMYFPDWEMLPYDHFSPHQDIVSSRLLTLSKMPQLQHGAIITTINTIIQRVSPITFLSGHVFSLKKGNKLNIDTTRRQLEKAGYRHVSQVQEHGEFTIRGSLIDLFPSGSDLPYRIDLFDDEIDSIRTFSPDTQRSFDKIEKIELLPAKEFPLSEEAIDLFRQNWRKQFTGNPLNCPLYHDISEGICAPGIEYYFPFFFEATATFFDYLPENALVVSIQDIHKRAEEFWQEIRLRHDQLRHDVQRPLLNPSQLFIPTPELFAQLQNYSQIQIDPNKELSQEYIFESVAPVILSIDHKASQPLQALMDWMKTFAGRILFCAETTGRREVLLQLLNSIKVHPRNYGSWQEFLAHSDTLGIIVAPLEEGLILEAPHIALISESQLFGKRVMQRRRRKTTEQDTDAIVKNLTELEIGAPIVHIDHGVGRYLGLQILKVGEHTGEFLHIEYANETKLYVPVASLHLISRYSGMDPEHAPLHKLGTEQWQKARKKAAEQVRDVAAELLEIYAKREAHSKEACASVDDHYVRFAESFAFEETPDQLQAIENIIKDMASTKPMDRLVCGDVGFGKTEVAMRAAFLAVQNNRQVVVLVPTTLLAQQHYQTFLDRFADWPIQIAPMSRFQTSKQHQKTIEELSQGKVDIVVGTHKLLQENIRFKSLGLIIIDEEHRFGVRQKERLKAMRSSIDILTLTATPIPRTLNMAFSGMRDLSIIATPPAKRLAIKTFVHEYNNAVIHEAVSREIMRGGQVYFLHNEVTTIEKIARELEKLIPEARAAFAHGQMHERELEQVMSNFYHRRFNLLVSTTIIESGIDIPSANTIIINRADKFGLAQLHQLRGRVGRSHHQAYAYLLTPPPKTLTSDAKKRLDAITSLEDLGVGFTLATHDMEIRGAGELLGEGQSGNMQAIGFTLYMDLLSRAVDALKSGQEPSLDFEKTSSQNPEIDLQIPAFIPEAYLEDVHLRLQCYKRISSAKNSRELDDIQVEMIDRFGLLPEQAKNLFSLTLLKQKISSLGIFKVEANSKGGKIEFSDKPNIDPMKIITLLQKQSSRFRLDGPTKLRFNLDAHEINDRLLLVEGILNKFL